MTGQTIYSEKCVTSVITVTILRKDLMFMRSKTLGINVRVTPAEKEKAQRKLPYYCADFLYRNICGGWGLERMLKQQSEKKIYRLFRQLKQLRTAIPQHSKEAEILHPLYRCGFPERDYVRQRKWLRYRSEQTVYTPKSRKTVNLVRAHPNTP